MFGLVKVASWCGFVLLVAIWTARVKNAGKVELAPTRDAFETAFRVSAILCHGSTVRGSWDSYLTDWQPGVEIVITTQFDDDDELRVTKLELKKCKDKRGFIPLK